MSRRKREPVAEIGAEDYLIVKHTHDVGVAKPLMVKALMDDNGCPAWDNWPAVQQHTCTAECEAYALAYWADKLAKPDQVYVRIHAALPGSWMEDEGWAFAYQETKPGRGAFPAVVFR